MGSAEDLWQGNNRTLLEGAKVIYVEGYFLSHSPEAAMELARIAQKHRITFVFNLCVENVLAILPQSRKQRAYCRATKSGRCTRRTENRWCWEALAIERIPGPVCLSVKFSSWNLFP